MTWRISLENAQAGKYTIFLKKNVRMNKRTGWIQPKKNLKKGENEKTQGVRREQDSCDLSKGRQVEDVRRFLIGFVFITGNSSVEPLLGGRLPQIHMHLSSQGFGPESNHDSQSWVRTPLARRRSWRNPGTVTIYQYQFNKTKQHTLNLFQGKVLRACRTRWPYK